MHTIIKQGKLLFALAVAATGAENLICAHVSQVVFANNRLAVPVLPYLPAIPILVYLVGIALLTAGVLIAIDVRPRSSAVLLGLFFMVCALSIYVPKAIARPLDLNVRTCIFEATALAAAALMLAGCRQREGDQLIEGNFAVDRAVDGFIAAAPYLFALSSVVFGVTHFLIPRFIASLVPAWMPGGTFWAYFTGAGFIVAGFSIATGVLARWGAFGWA
jgi:uncharacterized membrane protein YphA (DoxX/SURF4 family)